MRSNILLKASAVILIVAAVSSGAYAQNRTQADQLEKGAQDAAREVRARIVQFEKIVEARPAKLPDQWETLASGAQEGLQRVAEAKKFRKGFIETFNGISTSTGKLRTRLKEIQELFVSLSAAGRGELDGTAGLPPLPSALLPIVEREIAGHETWARICDEITQELVASLANERDTITVFERSEGFLTRLEQGLGGLTELAAIGQEVEAVKGKLESYRSQLNQILDIYESLATATAGKLAKHAPPIEPPAPVAEAPARPQPKDQVAGRLPALTATQSVAAKVAVATPVATKPSEPAVRSANTLHVPAAAKPTEFKPANQRTTVPAAPAPIAPAGYWGGYGDVRYTRN